MPYFSMHDYLSPVTITKYHFNNDDKSQVYLNFSFPLDASLIPTIYTSRVLFFSLNLVNKKQYILNNYSVNLKIFFTFDAHSCFINYFQIFPLTLLNYIIAISSNNNFIDQTYDLTSGLNFFNSLSDPLTYKFRTEPINHPYYEKNFLDLDLPFGISQLTQNLNIVINNAVADYDIIKMLNHLATTFLPTVNNPLPQKIDFSLLLNFSLL